MPPMDLQHLLLPLELAPLDAVIVLLIMATPSTVRLVIFTKASEPELRISNWWNGSQ